MTRHKEAITTENYTYTVVFEPALEGGYTVTCPALPGVVTEGDTLEEARRMAKEAIECYLESLQMDGLPIPTTKERKHALIHEEIIVELKAV